VHVVVVGNGVAGTEAASLVRAREPGWRVTVVSEESDHFFSRTALLYVLSGQLSYRATEPLERDAAARLGFERVRKRVVGLDPAARQLHLANAPPLSYDRLVIAAGSAPRRPPWPGAELGGVGHFVTLQDLQWLEQAVHGRPGVDLPPNPDAHLPHSTPESPYQPRSWRVGHRVRRPVVIGGGLVGVEVVEALLAAGLSPTFLMRDEWFWPVALDARESGVIEAALRHHGVDVRPQAVVERLEGHDHVERVVTAAGPVEADLVVVAVGVVPNTAWLGDAVERDAAGGVIVDPHLRTSAPDVWACGDCASVVWHDGRRGPEQLWYTARDQGRIAGRQVAGETDATYVRGPWYNSAKLMDVEYTTVGLVNQRVPGEESWFHAEPGPVGSTTRIVHVAGRVIGFNFLGRRWDHAVCVQWIRERRSLDWVLDHLGEAAFDTELVPPLRVPRRSP
jgi:NADPH-dependent 2,4-dienoyl-CoA reductase/sulfur reductase-like enzyme